MSIIIHQQDEISIYINESGSITISQPGYMGGDESFIYINAMHVSAVCKELQSCKKIIQADLGI